MDWIKIGIAIAIVTGIGYLATYFVFDTSPVTDAVDLLFPAVALIHSFPVLDTLVEILTYAGLFEFYMFSIKIAFRFINFLGIGDRSLIG